MSVESTKNADRESAPGVFTTTHWSVVGRAQDKSDTALNGLFECYRNPLLTWLLARHYSPHDAEDLVQGFFVSLLRHDFLREVGREKGKFRSFLLASLKNYLNDARDQKNALKRGGGRVPDSLQETDGRGQPLHNPAAPDGGPDREFDRAWAQTVLGNALRRLETECARSGHAALCAALEPVMFADPTAAPYREIGERLGLSESAVKSAAHRLRARIGAGIRDEIRHTVDNERDLKQELRYLASLFGK